jgi:catechol 2,3-dioxygenase-like lactoylglutathione lyase family enzyme
MPGIDRVATVTIAVEDQDEALRWFTEKLGFERRLDISGPGIRWLTVAPRKQAEVELLLASWFPEHVGKNATCVVATEDCRETYAELKGRGVEFSQTPQERPYGVEAVFQDLYGNRYALVEHMPMK